MAAHDDYRICLPTMDPAAQSWTLDNYLRPVRLSGMAAGARGPLDARSNHR